MSDPIAPVTLHKTTFSGVLAAPAMGKGRVESEIWSQTTYPNGSTVTRIYHQPIEVYDNRTVITQHNVRPSLDVLV
jgi:hypothetical protein